MAPILCTSVRLNQFGQTARSAVFGGALTVFRANGGGDDVSRVLYLVCKATNKCTVAATYGYSLQNPSLGS